jgi:YHS domain-containing protein
VYEANETGKFESMEEIIEYYVKIGHEYQLSYKGKEYFLSMYSPGKRELLFSIGRTWLDEKPFQYDTFDEMLDCFKEGEKSLGEFLPETEIEELRHKLDIKKTSSDLTYNGNVYFLCRYPGKSKIIFTIATNFQNENPYEFDSFDELMDNFKVEEKKLREIILDMDVEYEY